MIGFPLAEGEAFGRGAWAHIPSYIDVSALRSRMALVSWQRYVASSWRLNVRVTGRWDATCTQAVLEIQRACHIPLSGVLDTETWEATWHAQRHERPISP